jgi:hypothetical protein
MSMVMKTRLVLALLAIQDFSMCSQVAAKEEWPDGPNKSWFQTLQRPDNDKNPSRDEKSRFCCGIADTVKTKFRVEAGDARHPDDRWYAWLDNGWVLIPPEKIVADHAPDGQAYLFMLANTIQCFVRPKGGI